MMFLLVAYWLLLLVITPFALYLGFLALIARRGFTDRDPMPAPAPLREENLCRFCFVVPARNEASGILTTIGSLESVNYPRDLYEILVIADNCTDDTAVLAAKTSAKVLQRNDLTRRGKGWALAFAFDHLLASNTSDAFVIVDADSVVAPDFLMVLANHLRSGAMALQSQGTVVGARTSWQMALQAIAFAAFNTTRSIARSNLGLSCGLRGNGMCLTRSALEKVPYQAFSIVEDIEYGIALYRQGVSVSYAHGALIASVMLILGGPKAVEQRRRWGGGRWELFKREFLPLFKDAVKLRDVGYLDLACDLLTPPLTYLLTGMVVALSILFFLPWSNVLAFLWGFDLVLFLFYGVVACHYSGLGWSLAFRSLLYAPVFMLWKIVRVSSFKTAKGWEMPIQR